MCFALCLGPKNLNFTITGGNGQFVHHAFFRQGFRYSQNNSVGGLPICSLREFCSTVT